MTDMTSNDIPALSKEHPTASNAASNVEQITFKLNDGTKELMPAKTYPRVYARDTTGGPSCLTSLDALGPGAMAKICQLPQGLVGTECLNGCVGTSNTPTFEDIKAILALHDLPHDVVHEIHSCVLQREGFEEMQWAHVLDANLVLEPRKLALLFAMYNLVLHFIMAHGKTSKVKKVRPQLTMSQKAARHAKFAALTDDVNGACATYMGKVQALSRKHGQ
ncbi:hypothetical protein DFJ58DRAFT_736234 [Suillus subalutaceus]|uniref:uncharacterized protein n=1 Tax=Suillus subalutaceus TaxID=48586 RepID=UPI001B85E333|nr:uncharacterized protein DFJ58DRAFT_736234 [Suillus subalutaceus]KAG1832899.1 hypothetical protein DFJ58DRAFT_736234 [Suillus subalutaceus]